MLSVSDFIVWLSSDFINIDFLKETLVWSQQHVFTPFVAQYFIQCPSFALLLVYFWEVLESVSYLFSDSYFGGSEEIETISDSYIGDPVCGFVGISCAIVMSYCIHAPRVYTHPKLIQREQAHLATRDEISFDRAFRPDHLDALVASILSPLSFNSRPIIIILGITVIFGLTKQFDWRFPGLVGYSLSFAANILVGIIAFVLLRNLRQIQWAATQSVPEPQVLAQIARSMGQTEEMTPRVVDSEASGFTYSDSVDIRTQVRERLKNASFISPPYYEIDDQVADVSTSSPSVVEDHSERVGATPVTASEKSGISPSSGVPEGVGIGSAPLISSPLMTHDDDFMVHHEHEEENRPVLTGASYLSGEGPTAQTLSSEESPQEEYAGTMFTRESLEGLRSEGQVSNQPSPTDASICGSERNMREVTDVESRYDEYENNVGASPMEPHLHSDVVSSGHVREGRSSLRRSEVAPDSEVDEGDSEATVGPLDRIDRKSSAVEWHLVYFYGLCCVTVFGFIQILFLPNTSMWFFTVVPMIVGTVVFGIFYPPIRRRRLVAAMEQEGVNAASSSAVVKE